jgi:hypothetical protein
MACYQSIDSTKRYEWYVGELSFFAARPGGTVIAK